MTLHEIWHLLLAVTNVISTIIIVIVYKKISKEIYKIIKIKEKLDIK